MIKRLLAAFKKPMASDIDTQRDGNSEPFVQIYELLFADRLELFRPADLVATAPWQKTLFGEPGPEEVAAIASDATIESRIRLLAYRWLRANGSPVQSKEILGVVVEVGLEPGNDTLAAYADGSVRYINHSGKFAVFDLGPPEVVELAQKLIQVSRPTVDQIGPWSQPRRAPPARGDIRLTFLVADGLYFGEGPYSLLRIEPLAAQVIRTAEQLLERCVETALAKA